LRLGQHHLSVLAAFPAANPDNAWCRIEVGYLQVGYFRYAETRAIHGGQHRPVFEVPGRFEQSPDLALTRNDGHLLFHTGQWDSVDLDSPVQCVLVEKAERADSLNVSGQLDPLFVEQEYLPRPDLFRTELIGRFFGSVGRTRRPPGCSTSRLPKRSCECEDLPAFAV
jgi:hypothetical protein